MISTAFHADHRSTRKLDMNRASIDVCEDKHFTHAKFWTPECL
jgi:hypothetical protein